MNSMEKQLETINVCTKVATKTEQTSRQDPTKTKNHSRFCASFNLTSSAVPFVTKLLLEFNPELLKHSQIIDYLAKGFKIPDFLEKLA